MDVAGMFPQRRRKSRGDYLVVAEHRPNSEHAGLLLPISRFGNRFWDLRRGYICRLLVEKYQLLHEEVASNVRKVRPLLSMSAGEKAEVITW